MRGPSPRPKLEERLPGGVIGRRGKFTTGVLFTFARLYYSHFQAYAEGDCSSVTCITQMALPSNSANEPAIQRLVDDNLEYIFILNATPSPPVHKHTVEHTTTVATSQLCTRWRSIAFNYTTIWALIIDYHRHSLKWIETLLDRSYPSPLDIGTRSSIFYLDEDGEGKSEDALELVSNHIDRLRIFNLHVPFRSREFVCSRFLQMPAPNLEIFHIFYDIVGHLTHPLFNNHAPNLRSLGLHWCTINISHQTLC